MAKAPSSRPSVLDIFPEHPQANPSSRDEAAVVVVVEPTPNDILCGQPKTFAAHPGNIRYQAIIAREAVHYNHAARTKQDRMQMTRQIVADLLHNHQSRFLQLNSAAKWQQLSDPKARDKVSHALREYYKKHSCDQGNNNNNHQQQNQSASTNIDESSEEDDGRVVLKAATSTSEQEHEQQQQQHQQHHQRMVSDETLQEAATEAASITTTNNDDKNDHTMRSVGEIKDLLLLSLNNAGTIGSSISNSNTVTSMDILLDTLRSRDRDDYLLPFDAENSSSSLRSCRDNDPVGQLLQMDIQEWDANRSTSLSQLPPLDDGDDDGNSSSAVEVANSTTTEAAVLVAGSRDLQRLFEEPHDDVVMEDGDD